MRTTPLPLRSVLTPLVAAVLTVAAVGCSSTSGEPTPTPADSHGYVEGAQELSEPQLSLVLGGSDGALGTLDLITEEQATLLAPADGEVRTVTGDGRFIFRVEESGDETRVDIVDSGVWSVEHGDHFHYYRSDPRAIGTVTGDGAAVVRTADQRTAITFPDAGEVVILDHDDLEDGTVGDPARVPITPHPAAVSIPFGGVLLTTAPDSAGAPAAVQAIADDGTRIADPIDCPEASSATLTRVGVVFACRTGAILATETDDVVSFEEIPYPPGADAPAAPSLHGRPGRPSIAGVAGETGAWRLDTRAREWVHLPSDIPLVAVSAVADDSDLSIAVDDTGRIRILDAVGTVLAVTDPVLAGSVTDPDTRSQIRVVVDAQRAYVSDPAGNRVFEIDYRDNARIARTFTAPGAVFLEQVG